MTKNFNPFVLFFLFIVINLTVNSQNNGLKSCGFDHKHHTLMQNTKYQQLIQFSESSASTYLSNPQARSSSIIYTIPVVVHVLHLGENIGVGTNISDAQIQSAISNLNDVYRGQTAGSPVDFEIEFALAQQDPNCMAHSGINRINASAVPNYLTGGVDYYGDGGEADETILKDLSRWPETEYFNIWIVSEIENNNGGFGIQGYANFFTGSAYEGSIMMATVFGYDPNNSQPTFNLNAPRDNSTVVHEIGHYLHLHHTFKGDGDADNDGIGDACPGDVTVGVDSDGCPDTEPHKRYTSQCKSGLLNDCTGATFGDNTAKNFMSYASCQDRLTPDQKNRSRAMLATSGISLLYSQGDESPIISSGSLANASCIPQSSSTATSGGYGGIMNFTIINEFSASSSNAQNDGGYVDFTTECLKTISLQEDSTYNFEITTWYNGHDYKGYIDFNNDGDFLDPNEEVFSGTNPPNINGANGVNTSTGNGTLTIPISNGTNILANTPLRLRIISELTSVTGNITDACYNPFYAQAEDYQLIINQATASLSADFTANNINICLGSSISFSDASAGNPTSWVWNFGDGNSSTLQNPTHTYSNPGTYNVSLTVSDGGSTDTETKTSFITVISSVNTQENITSCNNYSWNGSSYSQSGNYTDTLLSILGCDSIVTINLTISNGFFSEETLTACDSLIWSVNGNNYTQTGIYYDSLQSSNGCDSIYKLDVTITTSTTDFSYGGATDFCLGGANPIATIVGGSSGTFTATGGLLIDSLTGEIDLSVASSGNYQVTYNPSNSNFSGTGIWQQLGQSVLNPGISSNSGMNIYQFGVYNTISRNGNRIAFSYNSGNASSFGEVEVYEISSGNWVKVGNTITMGINGDFFGQSISLNNDGNRIVIGSPGSYASNSNTGKIIVFELNGNIWTQLGSTILGQFNEYIGQRECLNINDSGNVISISGKKGNTGNSGSYVRVYEFINNDWIQKGNDLPVSNIQYSEMRSSINSDGNIIAFSHNLTSINENYINNGAGMVEVYEFINNNWISKGSPIYGLNNDDYFGSSISLNSAGNILAIGASEYGKYDNNLNNGYVNVFEFSAGNWNNLGLTINGDQINSGFGYNVKLNSSGTKLLTSDWHYDINLSGPNVNDGSGRVQSYILNNGNWIQYGYDIYGNSYGDQFGYDISFSGTGSRFISSSPSSSFFGTGYIKVFNDSGYFDQNSCTKPMDITISETTYITDFISSCNNYNWNGIIYSQSGTYYDTLQTSSGCDSIITLNLTLNTGGSSQENITACNNYNWNGNNYNQSGSYLDTLQTVNGCDSIITLNLTISNYISSSENITSCNNYIWNGNTYYQSGTYIDTIATNTGCDSVITLNLALNQSITSNETIVSCNSYFWNGITYNQSGTYIDTLTTNTGCDSIITLFLTLNNSISTQENITSCSNFLWHGNNYSQSGIYYDTLNSINGCDSITILNLTINSVVYSQQSITNCNNYVWNGTTYIQSGTYIDTLQTVLGCDSIVTLFLTVNSPILFNDTVSVCNNYIWNGNSYSQTGIYVDTLLSTLGCDSITSLHLTINGSYLSVDSVSACGSYIWNGITIDSSGVYSDTLQSVNGCDSINVLYLTVNNDVFAPLTFELLLDDYCLETNWTIKDSQDSIWYNEGPYDCNPSGGGIQSNTTIIKDLYLKNNECFTFELNDVYGDGLGASYYGGTDGNWLLKDLNNVILSQGSGDFGYTLTKSFFVTQSTPSSINTIENTNGQIYIAPNPFKNSAIVKIKNVQGPFNLEIFDIGGRVIKTFYSIKNEFEINNINASSGIYWLRDKNKSNLKPIKLVIE